MKVFVGAFIPAAVEDENNDERDEKVDAPNEEEDRERLIAYDDEISNERSLVGSRNGRSCEASFFSFGSEEEEEGSIPGPVAVPVTEEDAARQTESVLRLIFSLIRLSKE